MADISAELITKLYADYPALAFLINDPEIGPLLVRALNPDPTDPTTLTPAAFQAELAKTAWWKTSSASQRQWETLYNTDRASADQQLAKRHQEMANYAVSLGLEVPDQKLWDATEYSLAHGLAANDPQIQGMLSWYSPQGAPAMQPDLRGMANQYLAPQTDGDIGWWSREIAAGRQTQATYKAHLTTIAAGRFPTLANQINAGVTPEQLFSAQRNAVARELEVDPSTIDLMNDPRWSQILGVAPKDGVQRPMTYSESIAFARSQPEFKFTTGANTMAPDLGQKILTTLGAIK